MSGQDPKRSIFADPETGLPLVDPLTGKPYNIVCQTIEDIYGTPTPPHATTSNKVIACLLGDPAGTARQKQGLTAQIAKQYTSGGLGFGYGARTRATIWWKNPDDSADPQPLV